MASIFIFPITICYASIHILEIDDQKGNQMGKTQTTHSKQKTLYPILFIVGLTHLLIDSLQAVIPDMCPILETSLGLTFTQLGFIAFTLDMVASVKIGR